MSSSPRWFSLRRLLPFIFNPHRSGAAAAGLRGWRRWATAMSVASPATPAPASIAARSPPTPAMRLPWLAVSAIAGSSAAPTPAPIWRLVLITPPTKPWSPSATPRLAVTIAPNAVPAVPKPTKVTAASSGLYPPVAGRWVRTRKPAVATALVSTSSRATPSRAASRAPVSPATKPTTPCGAMASPVISGESCRTCWKYRDRTSISPPFQTPSSMISAPPLRSELSRSRFAADQRVGGVSLGDGEPGQRGHGHPGCGQHQRRRPARRAALGHREHHRGDHERDEQRAGHVEAAPFPLLPAPAQQPRGEQHRGQPDRHIDQEHRAPAGELDQDAAQHLAGHEPDGRGRAVQAECAGARRALGKAGGDQGQGGRGDQGRTHALHRPRRDQQHRDPEPARRPARRWKRRSARSRTSSAGRTGRRPGRRE